MLTLWIAYVKCTLDGLDCVKGNQDGVDYIGLCSHAGFSGVNFSCCV